MALIPYLMGGFPDLGVTRDMVLAAEQAGAAVVELGIPFSDPLADGPAIQAAGQIALGNRVTVGKVLELVASLRQQTAVPLVAMSYINPLLSYGIERFAADARSSGLDGLIVPDLPVEEAGEVEARLIEKGLDLIMLVAPTSAPDRIALASSHSHGFIYCVSLRGVTGARAALAGDVMRLLEQVGKVSKVPRALGFGISTPEQVRSVRGHTEAVVVGSALIDLALRHRGHEATEVGRFVGELVAAAGD